MTLPAQVVVQEIDLAMNEICDEIATHVWTIEMRHRCSLDQTADRTDACLPMPLEIFSLALSRSKI